LQWGPIILSRPQIALRGNYGLQGGYANTDQVSVGSAQAFCHRLRESSFADSRLHNFNLKSLPPVFGAIQYFPQKLICAPNELRKPTMVMQPLLQAGETGPCDRFLSLAAHFINVFDTSPRCGFG
jgi:hypothetical protein